jgi:hypothetical protein
MRLAAGKDSSWALVGEQGNRWFAVQAEVDAGFLAIETKPRTGFFFLRTKGFFTYHGFVTITTSSRIISRDKARE